MSLGSPREDWGGAGDSSPAWHLGQARAPTTVQRRDSHHCHPEQGPEARSAKVEGRKCQDRHVTVQCPVSLLAPRLEEHTGLATKRDRNQEGASQLYRLIFKQSLCRPLSHSRCLPGWPLMRAYAGRSPPLWTPPRPDSLLLLVLTGSLEASIQLVDIDLVQALFLRDCSKQEALGQGLAGGQKAAMGRRTGTTQVQLGMESRVQWSQCCQGDTATPAQLWLPYTLAHHVTLVK